jgi:hypothetical protein
MRRREDPSHPPIIPWLFGVDAIEILASALRHPLRISGLGRRQRPPPFVTAIPFGFLHRQGQGREPSLLMLEQAVTVGPAAHLGKSQLDAIIFPSADRT